MILPAVSRCVKTWRLFPCVIAGSHVKTGPVRHPRRTCFASLHKWRIDLSLQVSMGTVLTDQVLSHSSGTKTRIPEQQEIYAGDMVELAVKNHLRNDLRGRQKAERLENWMFWAEFHCFMRRVRYEIS